MSEHPMDHIPVRQLRFDFADDLDPVWSRSCPDFAIFINALGVHVPHFEHFLVRVMRASRDELGAGNFRLASLPVTRPSPFSAG